MFVLLLLSFGLYKSCDDAKSKSEAESLASSLESFEFLLSMVIWYKILFAINMVSKKFQSKSMCIDTTTKELEGVMLFFEKYRNEGFESSMNIVKSLAFDMNIESILPTKRCVFRKKQFDENNHDEEIQSAEQLNIFENIFGFLFDSKKLKSLGDNELRESCTKFKTTFFHNNLSDVDANDLFFLNESVANDFVKCVNVTT